MSTHVSVTVAGLNAGSLDRTYALRHNPQTVVSVSLEDGTQLHFESHADMIAFGEKLAALPIRRLHPKVEEAA